MRNHITLYVSKEHKDETYLIQYRGTYSSSELDCPTLIVAELIKRIEMAEWTIGKILKENAGKYVFLSLDGCRKKMTMRDSLRKKLEFMVKKHNLAFEKSVST